MENAIRPFKRGSLGRKIALRKLSTCKYHKKSGPSDKSRTVDGTLRTGPQ